MIALAAVLIAILLSLLVTRVATVALTLTGLSREAARFQARSALSGTGFTTSESEAVVNHPVRRRIVMTLILIGSAGIVTVIGTLVLSFANSDRDARGLRLAILVGGLFVVWLIARSDKIERHLSRLIGRVLTRLTDLDARDYAALLHLAETFTVLELAVEPGDWVAGRALGELGLRDEGIVVLGITRADGSYVGVPQFTTEIRAGDALLVYGREPRLKELDVRCAGQEGDAAHEQAVAEQAALIEEQDAPPPPVP